MGPRGAVLGGLIIGGTGLLVLSELLLSDHIPASGVWWCGEANGLACLDAMAQAQLEEIERIEAQAANLTGANRADNRDAKSQGYYRGGNSVAPKAGRV
jgi:hypothetical protein